MTREDIITSLKDQACDKDNLAGGDLDSIFTHDATMLLEAAELLQGRHTKLDRSRWRGCGWCKRFQGKFDETKEDLYCRFCGRPLTEEAWAELERRIERCLT